MRFTLLLALSLVLASPAIHAQVIGKPNIVLIMCDDLGYADVGFNGALDIATPELDRLATNGTVFSSAYVAHPFCGPSRMALMTGRYPHDLGAPFNLPNHGLGIEEYNREGVPVDEKLISKVLQEAGYFTGAIGKWHMGEGPKFHPNKRGFDDYYGFLGGGHKYFPSQYQPIYERQLRAGKKHINDYLRPLEHNGNNVVETEYITDALSREAVRFVKEANAKDQPFFLYLAYNAPHSPLEAKEDDLARFAGIEDDKRRCYAAMVYAVDRGVGRLVRTLQATNELKNTLLVFLSDNGGKLALGANNGPLREGKGSTHEGGYRVPLFFHWPGVVPAGKRVDHPVTALDFYPTFAGLAGAEIPETKKLSGKNIWEDLLAGRNPRKGEMIYALRHRNGFSDVGARRDQWKICRTQNKSWQLFDLKEDIGEKNDLSGTHPTLLQSMVSDAGKWATSHSQPRWFDNLKAGKDWRAAGMPRHEATFKVN